MRNKSGDDPADNHPRHAERDKYAAVFRRCHFRKKRCDRWDAGTQTKTGGDAEGSKEGKAVYEENRYCKQRIDGNGNGQCLLPADFIGYDTGYDSTDDNANQTEGGQASGEQLA